jgi:hypothetical protein
MTATGSSYLVAKRIQKIVETLQEELGLGPVLYGDHQKISVNRTVCVVADTKRRELRNAPRVTQNTITTQVLVYHGTVENVQQNLEDCDVLAEAIEARIHEYPRLTDPEDPDNAETALVYHSLVTVADPGLRARGSENTQWKTHRLTVESQALTMLPSL